MNCKDQVMKYLFQQNRPYSTNDVMQNLNNGCSRATVQKALDELILEKKIKEKVYGKQKVYSTFHDSNLLEVEEEKKHIDLETEKISNKIEFLETDLKNIECEIKAIEKYPSTSNALTEKTSMAEIVRKLSEEVNVFHQFSKEEICSKEKEINDLNCTYKDLSKEYKKRKFIYTDAINTILDNYPKKLDIFLAEVGIEKI